MCACVCVCVCVCAVGGWMCVCERACVHVCMHACMHAGGGWEGRNCVKVNNIMRLFSFLYLAASQATHIHYFPVYK